MLRQEIKKELGCPDQEQDNEKATVYQYAKVETPESLDLSKYDQFVPTNDRPIEYPFELDDFQKQAFIRIYQGKHVFVSAHTSAGKTITAEWAIALALTNGKKAIYTSPIKALSNQKFRDFKIKFNKLELEEYDNDCDYSGGGFDDGFDDYDDFGYSGGYSGGYSAGYSGGFSASSGRTSYGGYSGSQASQPAPIYDFQGMRGDKESDDKVGIITGDVQVNKDAPCLVLTTEILRTMIYDNDKILQELECVVFDEIHYMNDAERGRVWEEVITLLPPHVNMLFLSATTPNAVEFAEWVGRVKGRAVHVISTPKRPIPLEHYLHVETNDHNLTDYFKSEDDMKTEYLDKLDPTQVDIAEEIEKTKTMKFPKRPLKELTDEELAFREKDGTYLVVGKDGIFDEEMMRTVKQKTLHKGGQARGENHMRSAISFKQAKHHWIQLFKLLRIKQKFPVVVFVFSKKRCVDLTENLKNEDYTSKREKSRIHVFTEKCLERLPEHDRTLPQIQFVLELLKRGIAVHHGGLLPILKEMTEILFTKGFIRILFATETFAMGINMPTRSVVFSQVSKHDGTQFRNLLPGEYTQMSGRAGRRGLDSVGTVVITNWKPNQIDYKKMISGKPLELVSKFHLTYQTILNVWRQHSLDRDVTDLMRCSFQEFAGGHDATAVFRIERLVRSVKTEIAKLEQTSPTLPEGFLEGWQGVVSLGEKNAGLLEYMYATPPLRKKYLSPGCLILVMPENGLVLSTMRLKTVLDTHLEATYLPDETQSVEILWEWVAGVLMEENKAYASPITQGVSRSLRVPIEQAMVWTEINDGIQRYFRWLDNFNETMPLKDPELGTRVGELCYYHQSINQLQAKRHDQALTLYPDYYRKTEVLKKMGYADRDEVLTLKGRIAARINTSHALIFTEFLLEYGLVDLPPHEVATLLSTLIFTEGKGEQSEFKTLGGIVGERLTRKLEKMKLTMNRVFDAQVDAKMEFDHDKFKKENFHTGLAEFVYYWCQGMTFAEVLQQISGPELTGATAAIQKDDILKSHFDVEEGTIVRAVMRLDEFCQEIDRASAVIGDPALSPLMQKTSQALRRDIIFCGSLYI